ncbi:MAG: phosphoribosylamine--glycine ligase [Proteobacteria bacterium]|nr:phosphoribosylamine--glycine ligase [Pseudomonadota bacterium]
MRVLVVGSGGREHALCWALGASPICDFLACAPGNGGIAEVATCIDIGVMDFDRLISYCRDEAIEFVVVGPEAPLAAGLVDRLDAAGINSFGPRANAAILEGSKGFTKDLCAKHGIPTGRYGRFSEGGPAKAFAAELGAPVVVKADGLAAGKGVVIAQTLGEAESAIDAILGGQFGEAGAELVVEEFLEGEEASFFALVDGEHVLPLASAQDHKAVGEGDTGPNTGGMGAYSPAPIVAETMAGDIMTRIIRPTVAAMAAEGRPFKGVLYAGLMITAQGPQLLEYNVRFGDPECQVLMPRLKSDLLPLLLAASDGVLNHVDARWYDEAALCVVMAAKGYPGAYDKGTPIGGLAEAAAMEGVTIFQAGTAKGDEGLVATGGRVLGVTALGGTVAVAQHRAYAAVDLIDWPGGFCRRDIGWRAVGELADA